VGTIVDDHQLVDRRVRVALGDRQARVPEELLDRTQIRAAIEQVGSARVTEGVRMEIGGHTDAQGGEGMNLNLSQSRAEAVLNGVLARGVLVTNLTAQGYGESQPIADNDTTSSR